jgi:hypothetical protein
MSSRRSARYCRFILNIYHNRMHFAETLRCLRIRIADNSLCTRLFRVATDPASGTDMHCSAMQLWLYN